jgi:hypothetical protein
MAAVEEHVAVADANADGAAGERTESKRNRKRGAKKSPTDDGSAPASDELAGSTNGGSADLERKDSMRGAPKCKQCNKRVDELFRDAADGKLYCAPCWKKFYKKNPPAEARFEQGAPKEPRELPAEVIGEPIAGPHAEVDQYYEAALREGAPQVFVDNQGVSWSVMLKGATDKFAYQNVQLLVHDDCFVVYRRAGHINLGADAAKETYDDFARDQLAQAKRQYENLFMELTKNKFTEVKGCVTKFITRGDYTLTKDVKAARRAENELNRQAREDEQKKVFVMRDAQIAATATADLVRELKAESEGAQDAIARDPNLQEAQTAATADLVRELKAETRGAQRAQARDPDARDAQLAAATELVHDLTAENEGAQRALARDSDARDAHLAAAAHLVHDLKAETEGAHRAMVRERSATPEVRNSSNGMLMSDSGPAEPPCTPAVGPQAVQPHMHLPPPPPADPHNSIVPPPQTRQHPPASPQMKPAAVQGVAITIAQPSSASASPVGARKDMSTSNVLSDSGPAEPPNTPAVEGDGQPLAPSRRALPDARNTLLPPSKSPQHAPVHLTVPPPSAAATAKPTNTAAPTSATAPKTVPQPAAAAEQKPARRTFDVEEEEKKSGVPLVAIGVATIAIVGIALYFVLGKNKKQH